MLDADVFSVHHTSGMVMNKQSREPAEGWLIGFRPRLLPEPRILVRAAHGAAARDGRDGREVQSLELGSDAADCCQY